MRADADGNNSHPITSGDGEVLVRVHLAGICGTDRGIYEWGPWAQSRVKVGIIIGKDKQADLEKSEIGLHSTPTVVNDVIIVGYDKAADAVDCGPGWDVVTFGPGDIVSSSCERRIKVTQ